MKVGGTLLILALLLAGCSGEPKPKEPDEITKPTPTSTATPPEMPAQAKEDSPEGAAAFVRYWVGVSNYASSTGDIVELQRISDPGCSGCTKYIDLYRSTYESGGAFEGGAWELGPLDIDYGDPEAYVETRISFPAGAFRSSASGKSVPSKAGNEAINFAVSTDPKTRVITQLGVGEIE